MIEAVWGAPSGEVLAGWPGQDAPPSTEVVCVVRRDGAVAGFSSVQAEPVDLVGRRRFWIYRSELADGATEQARELFRATFQVLEAEFDGAPDSPVGLCALLTAAEAAAEPEVEWLDPRALYAGYLDDGRQVRIAYFADASIAAEPEHWPSPDWTVKPGYRIEAFAGQDAVKSVDVVGLWLREGALPYAEAKRRLAEVLLVATDPDRRPVGISTAYLQRSDQLRADLWHFRLFVAAAHRQANLASALTLESCVHLGQRFVTGEDTRAIGVLAEIESEFLRRTFPMAVWPRVDLAFIGENDRGAHIRVHYFPGALAPGPQ